ncbi:MAG: molybdopterin-guanine dinucleotide biosynthesis protein B [Methylococcales bacterium]
MLHEVTIPKLGFAAYSGSGKTTLLTKVIPLLVVAGLRIGLIKHGHHNFQIDQPGKDSYRLREAGAEQVLLVGRRRSALIIEHPQPTQEPRLEDQFKHLDCEQLDLILVEGFKHAAIPKIEVYRSSMGHPQLYINDSHIIALVTDTAPEILPNIPVLDINQPQQVADFILNQWLTHD